MTDLIRAIRVWAGMPPDVVCEICGQPYYNATGLPVCYGCRRTGHRQMLIDTLLARIDRLLEADRELAVVFEVQGRCWPAATLAEASLRAAPNRDKR